MFLVATTLVLSELILFFDITFARSIAVIFLSFGRSVAVGSFLRHFSCCVHIVIILLFVKFYLQYKIKTTLLDHNRYKNFSSHSYFANFPTHYPHLMRTHTPKIMDMTLPPLSFPWILQDLWSNQCCTIAVLVYFSPTKSYYTKLNNIYLICFNSYF